MEIAIWIGVGSILAGIILSTIVLISENHPEGETFWGEVLEWASACIIGIVAFILILAGIQMLTKDSK